MDLAQLQAQRDALRTALYQGVLSVRAGDKSVNYKSNAEMREALRELEAEIQNMKGKKRVKRILPYGVKSV